jgi:putative NIF3 family GTP cyclohydrolase 1 type 2
MPTRDDLVSALDAYFGVAEVRGDTWDEIFSVVYEEPYWKDFTERGWRRSFNGLMVKGADEVTNVATAVFPGDELIARLAPGTFLFTEHPIDDVPGDFFAPLSRATFRRMRHDGISVYMAHAPLDHHPVMSPSHIIARALPLRDATPFLPSAQGIAGGSGVIGDVDLSVDALAARLQEVLGADIPVRIVSAARQEAGRVAVVAGGGASAESLEAALALGCTTYITGNAASPCTLPFVRAIHDAFRERARAAGVTVIDGTHYGTERPAQLAMVPWFQALGVEARFEPGVPERR